MSQKLPNKSTGSKTYWSILKTLLGNINIPCIPPVLHDNILVIDFRGKDIFFYIFYIIYLSDTFFFFSKQCSLPKGNSELLKNLLFLTEKRLSNIQISNDNIIKKI